MDLEDIELAGGEFGGSSVEKETDFAIAADGADSRHLQGQGLGGGVERFQGAGDKVGGGGDEKIGPDAVPDPAIDRGAETMNHDGHAESHADGDGEGGRGEAMAV